MTTLRNNNKRSIRHSAYEHSFRAYYIPGAAATARYAAVMLFAARKHWRYRRPPVGTAAYAGTSAHGKAQVFMCVQCYFGELSMADSQHR